MAVEFSPYSSIISATTAAPLPSPVKLRCYVLEPEVVFQASVNLATAVYPISEIPFDNVVIGAFGNIKPGMTILIGTSQGLENYGRTYARLDATSTVLYVGRSSKGGSHGEINAVDNAVIQVLNLYEVFAKNAFIAPDGTIYKNSNEIFVDQTSLSPPISNCGPGVAGTTNPITNLLTVQFNGTNSFATADGATISSYLWDIDDGTLTVGTLASSTITATFVSGVRWVSLKVTDSNGKFHVSRCPIYARFPGDDSDLLDFEITNHRITPAGQQVSVKVLSPIPADTLYDGTLVLIWDGNPATPADRTNMIFIGWLHTEQDRIAAQRTGTLAETTLNLLDVAGKLNTLPGFPQIVEYNNTPTNWTQMKKANMDRYMTYLLRWHSTALDLADWSTTGTGDAYPFVVLASDGASLWQQVEQRAKSMVPNHVLGVNTLGQLQVKPDPMLLDIADRTATVQAALDGSQWSMIPHTHQRPARAHWLRSNAILASSTTIGTAFCIAPGTAPGQGETAMEQGEQLAISQAALNAQEGHRYARINAPESHFNITLASTSSATGDMLAELVEAPANMTWVELTLPATVAAQRGLSFTSARGLVHSINIRYQHARTGLTRTVELEWELETSGPPAVTVTVPAATPINNGWTPNPTPTDTPIPPPVLPAGLNKVAVIDNYGQIFTTTNFQNASPTWAINDDMFTSGQTSGSAPLFSFVVDPFSPLYRGTGTTVRGFACNRRYIFRIDDIFGVNGPATATSIYSFSETGILVIDRKIMASFGRFQPDETDNPWLLVLTNTAATSGSSFVGLYSNYSLNGGQTWSAPVPLNLGSTASNEQNWTAIHGHPGVYLSPRTPGLAYAGGWEPDPIPPIPGRFYKSNGGWGGAWIPLVATDSNALVLGEGLGDCIMIPWADNSDEAIKYGGSMDTAADTLLNYRTMRNHDTNISPVVAGKSFGPYRFQFSITAYDNDRQFIVLAGRSNGVDAVEQSTASKQGVFLSSDAGDTWTTIIAPVAAYPNQSYPTSAAFAHDTPEVIYIWGNSRFIKMSADGGATILNKEGNIGPLGSAGEELVGFVGGDI